MDSFGSQGSKQALGRRGSVNIKPLLTFDGGEQLPNVSPKTRLANSRSVFGVDMIWEHEMAKLQEIEAAEKLVAEEDRKREEQLEAKQKKKIKKRKGKKTTSKGGAPENAPDTPTTESVAQNTRVSEEPPVLPVIQKTTARGRPPVVDDESDESDENLARVSPQMLKDGDTAAAGWFAGSSDEDDPGPRRTTGTGPRYRKAPRVQVPDEDSEEDLPLSVTLARAAQRATGRGFATNDSEEEETPLSVLLQKTKSSLPSIASSTRAKNDDDDDDDNQPLGLRASKAFTSSRALKPDPDDDDKPLAFHPQQQRRTQYQMLAHQHQQQQQQLLMQAQLQNSIFFGAPPGMMGSGYFGQPIPMPMMIPQPMPIPSPPPMHDVAKFGRVDRWRRDVVVEKEV
jgi:hypothetical protein